MKDKPQFKQSAYATWVASHYHTIWGSEVSTKKLTTGPMVRVQSDFHILEFPPHGKRKAWAYATCGMADTTKSSAIELHLYAKERDAIHVETLTAIAHYHLAGNPIDLHHTVNIGRPWLSESHCSYGYVSLPYLDGPQLEIGTYGSMKARFLWLIPITPEEVEYKKRFGAEALEQLFESAKFDYLDPTRGSVTELNG